MNTFRFILFMFFLAIAIAYCWNLYDDDSLIPGIIENFLGDGFIAKFLSIILLFAIVIFTLYLGGNWFYKAFIEGSQHVTDLETVEQTLNYITEGGSL